MASRLLQRYDLTMPPCQIPPPSGCKPSRISANASLATLVRRFRHEHCSRADGELHYFRTMPSFELAIQHAALAENERSKRYDHQRRHSRSTLQRAQRAIIEIAHALRSARCFDDLHELLKQAIYPIHGLKEMYTYDTALRLGAYLRLRPERVYLHRGTRDGARALGLDATNDSLAMSELPNELQSLSAVEAEDFLCIFKNHFHRTH